MPTATASRATSTEEQDEQAALDAIAALTQSIRDRQADIAELGLKRKAEMVRLRAMGVTYKRIAKAAGITDQVVYKILGEVIATARSIACPTCSTVFDPVRVRLCPTCHPASE